MGHAHLLRVVSLTLVALLLPFAAVLGYVTTDPVFSYGVNLYLFDLPQALLVAATIPALARGLRARSLGLGAGLWAVIASVVLLSFAVHPSLEGVQTIFRVLGALSIAVAFAGLDRRERTLVLGALAVATLTQTAWSVAQVLTGGPLGASWLFESQKPLARAGDAWVPKGTMQTPYLLTALALVSSLLLTRHALRARTVSWAFAIIALVIPVGLTYSRGALAGLVAAIAVLAPRAHTDLARRIVVVALAAGVAVPGALTWSGWLARGEQFGEERADSGRGILMLQGLAVFAMEPLMGVGPGRYMAAVRSLTDDPGTRARLLPTHDVPLLVAAESGVVAGAAVIVLLGALVLRALRDRDDAAIALYLVMLPFWLLDPLPYALPQGTVLTGLWLGALDSAHRQPAR